MDGNSGAKSALRTAARRRPATRIALFAIVAAVATLGIKLGVWWVTGSAAMLGDALESLVNIFAAAMALFSVWYASRPPDREHPYGHGKVEFIASVNEGLLIVLAGVGIGIEAIRRLIYGHTIEQLTFGIVASLMIAVGLLLFGRYIHQRGVDLHSATLIADGKHLMTDAASTLGVAVALGLVAVTDQVWIDPAAALLICLLVWWTGGRLIKQGTDGLMDRIDETDDAAIRDILDDEVRSGRIRDYHKVRHRHQGAYHWVDMHIQVDPEMTVEQAHHAASQVERRIQGHLGNANATAHIEPDRTSEDPDPGAAI